MCGTAVGLENGVSENWQKTIGAHQIFGCAHVTWDCYFEMTITIHSRDMYNFNKGAKDIGSDTSDSINGRFEALGWAKSFKTEGSLTKTVRWSYGETEYEEVPDRGIFR